MIHKDVIVLWTPQDTQGCHCSMYSPRYTRMSLFYGLPMIHKGVIVHGLPKIHKDVIVQWNPHDTQGCHCSMDSPRYTRMSLFNGIPMIPKDVIVQWNPHDTQGCHCLWTPPRYPKYLKIFHHLDQLYLDSILVLRDCRNTLIPS